MEKTLDKSEHPVCKMCIHCDSTTTPCLDPVPCDEVPKGKLKPEYQVDGNGKRKKAQEQESAAVQESAEEQQESKPEEAPAEVRTKIEKVTEYLRYDFTKDELAELSEKLASTINTHRQSEANKKSVVKQIDSEIAKLESEISMYATKVHDKFEYRNIECEWRFDYEARTKTLFRMDSGDSVRTKNLTADELQVPLPV